MYLEIIILVDYVNIGKHTFTVKIINSNFYNRLNACIEIIVDVLNVLIVLSSPLFLLQVMLCNSLTCLGSS